MNDVTTQLTATNWDDLYFYGLTKSPLSEVGLNQNMVQALIGMVGATASVSTGALINPKYMFNQKGTTPWVVMYALVTMKQPELLDKVFNGAAAAFVPNQAIEPIFIDHINWPSDMLANYDIELEGFNVFILPFMVPNTSRYNLTLSQSMKAPDGSLEIFGVGKFDENKPEDVLASIQDALVFIKMHRQDVWG
ncbi:hypothetical protein [Saccharophagus degradans]|uniref:Suppressor of fused-like domain-containing protein n=1 Tax=Saccharophagus degradans TaxID=86304 RepID=A0AAW7X077_9GAMM|nr:hypothetical protein [Saccharophagus degradans]MDO6420887.1 hypothetical protein [Saccharophagus degradans]MDO6609736.1 hypothetical protein [Saccharophagus degradans]